jgi:excisionase family DNA binding protein
LCIAHDSGMANPEALITSAEACESLGIDRSTLSRWVASGRIAPATKLPGIRGPFLFTRTEVQRIMAVAA